MKNVKKILALLLALLLLAGAAGTAAAEDAITISVRIEGFDKCLFYEEEFCVNEDTSTLADILEYISSLTGSPDIMIEDGEYGAYISEIGGLEQMSHGAMSGWNYRVNGAEPTVGISSYTPENGDDIIIYYGDPFGVGMQFPEIYAERTGDFLTVTAFSKDTVYDENWDASVVENPVSGATLIWDGQEYETDGGGMVLIPAAAGFHTVQIERYDGENGVPTVLRLPPKDEMFIQYYDCAPGAWYNPAVEFGVGAGFFSGMGGNMFRPDGLMTMAQLVTVLSRIAGAELTYEPGEPWYAAAMSWAIDSNVIHNSEYSPDGEVQREVFIHMFYKTVELVGKSDMHKKAVIIGAEDYDEITERYIGAIEWAVAAGLIVGTGTGHNSGLTIDPGALVSRAAVCQMLMNYYTS